MDSYRRCLKLRTDNRNLNLITGLVALRKMQPITLSVLNFKVTAFPSLLHQLLQVIVSPKLECKAFPPYILSKCQAPERPYLRVLAPEFKGLYAKESNYIFDDIYMAMPF